MRFSAVLCAGSLGDFSALKKSGYASGIASKLGSTPLVIIPCFDYDFDFINHFSIVAFPETTKS
jgi:hypothetical protein